MPHCRATSVRATIADTRDRRFTAHDDWRTHIFADIERHEIGDDFLAADPVR